MLAHVARAMRRGLALEGEPSLLRGVSCDKAVLMRQVRDDTGMPGTSNDNYVAATDRALIDVAFDPRVGDDFTHPDGAFVLDRLVHDNGVTRQFVVVPA